MASDAGVAGVGGAGGHWPKARCTGEDEEDEEEEMREPVLQKNEPLSVSETEIVKQMKLKYLALDHIRREWAFLLLTEGPKC